MKVEHHWKFARFDYNQNEDCKDIRKLGQVVYKKDSDNTEEIGVIIQVHENDEYRTDKFGNCCSDEISVAKMCDIRRLRPDILSHLN